MNLKKLLSISFCKTVFFNFKYFSLKTACRLPVIVYKRTDLTMTRGMVQLEATPHLGMIEIGKPETFSLDKKNNRTKWKCEGLVVFNGSASLGRGSVIRVLKGGRVVFGKNFFITGHSNIICEKEITFGNDCLLSWDILVMDTDFHTIKNITGEITNSPKPIYIGNRVWIGCDCKVLKGVIISDDIVVASGSILTKRYEQMNSIICQSGVIKTNITWEL